MKQCTSTVFIVSLDNGIENIIDESNAALYSNFGRIIPIQNDLRLGIGGGRTLCHRSRPEGAAAEDAAPVAAHLAAHPQLQVERNRRPVATAAAGQRCGDTDGGLAGRNTDDAEEGLEGTVGGDGSAARGDGGRGFDRGGRRARKARFARLVRNSRVRCVKCSLWVKSAMLLLVLNLHDFSGTQ